MQSEFNKVTLALLESAYRFQELCRACLDSKGLAALATHRHLEVSISDTGIRLESVDTTRTRRTVLAHQRLPAGGIRGGGD